MLGRLARGVIQEIHVSYGPVVIVIHELTVAWLAEVAAVAFGLHVLVGRLLGEKRHVAGVALVLRRVVIQGIHVLLTGSVCLEPPIASFTLESRPVVVLIHVVFAIILIVVFPITGIAFVHCDERSRKKLE